MIRIQTPPARNQPPAIVLTAYELTYEGEGKETEIGVEEIADPYAEREHYVEAGPFQVEQDHESVPDSAEAPVDTFDKGRMAEEIVSGNRKRDHYGNPDPQSATGGDVVNGLTERITVEKTVHIGSATKRARSISIRIIIPSEALSPISVPTTVDSLHCSRREM